MTNLIGAIRGSLGLAVGIIITLICSFGALILGLIWNRLFPGQPNPAGRIVGPWSWVIYHLCYRFIIGMKVVTDPIPPPRAGWATVVYGTHMPLETVPMFGRLAGGFSHQIKIVARHDIVSGRLGILVGKAAEACGLLLRIHRDNRRQALDEIEAGLASLAPGTVLFILADMHRPIEKYLLASRARHASRYPQILQWKTCMPHSGAILQSLAGYDSLDKPVQLVRFGMGFDKLMENGAEISQLTGSTLYIDIEESDGDSFPRDPEEAGARLRREWQGHHDITTLRQSRRRG